MLSQHTSSVPIPPFSHGCQFIYRHKSIATTSKKLRPGGLRDGGQVTTMCSPNGELEKQSSAIVRSAARPKIKIPTKRGCKTEEGLDLNGGRETSDREASAYSPNKAKPRKTSVPVAPRHSIVLRPRINNFRAAIFAELYFNCADSGSTPSIQVRTIIVRRGRVKRPRKVRTSAEPLVGL